MATTLRAGSWPLLAILAVQVAQGQTARSPQPSGPPAAASRTLDQSGMNAVELRLEAGDFIEFSVEQQPPQVNATLVGPAGEQVITAAGPGLPTFALAAIVPSAGRYRLEIRGAPEARYSLRVDALRPATPDDERTERVLRSVQEATQLLLPGPGGSSDQIRRGIALYGEALEYFTATGNRGGEAGALHRLAVAHLMLNDLPEAERYLDQAGQLWRELGLRGGELRVGSLKLDLDRRRGRSNQALAEGPALADAAHDLGDSALEAGILRLLRSVAENAGSLEDAIAYGQRVVALQPDAPGAAADLESIAALYLRLHAPRTSIAYRERAAAIYRARGRSKELAAALNWIASGYRTLGDIQTSLRYAKQAAELTPSADDAGVLASLGRYEEAIQVTRREIARHQANRNLPEESNAWMRLANIYSTAGRREPTLEAMEQALRALRASPENVQRARVEYLAANAMQYQEFGLPDKARELFEEYLRGMSARDVSGFPQYPSFLAAAARNERDLGLLEDARQHLETALQARQIDRSAIASPELGASSYAPARGIWDIYIDVLMRLHAQDPAKGYDAAALAASERARAYSLIESLGDATKRILEEVDPELAARERFLQDRLNEAALVRREAAASPGRAKQAEAAASEIQRLTAELELLRGETRRASPQYASLTAPVALTLNEIREQVVEPGTVLLEYSLSDVATSYVWAVKTDGLQSFPLASRSEIETAARRVLGPLRARQQRPSGETASERNARIARADAQYSDASATLSRMVLGPVANALVGQRLLVVADGPLAAVPFAALPSPDGGRPLVASHEIVRLPSASALVALRAAVEKRGPAPERGIAVLADPVFDSSDERLAAMRTSRAQQYPEALTRSLEETGLSLPRLSFSRMEADTIAAAAAPAEVFRAVDFRAAKAVAISPDLGRFRVVHFATHALLDDEAPSLSGVVLSLVDQHGEPQDGFLRLHEIYNLHLKADLVVLSACQTALGKEIRGEGTIGLSRGFLYAGAARVMASLWTVDDRATAELMSRFYRKYFGEHLSPARALRAAQLEMLESARWQAPYFWAAFELQGEWK